VIAVSRISRVAAASGTALAVSALAVSATNALSLPRPPRVRADVPETLAVCVPARNEAERLPALLGDLRSQIHVPRLRIYVMDDGSTDDTYECARRAAGTDPRVFIDRTATEPPAGWTGKAWACHRLSRQASADGAELIAFVDADVRLDPVALATTAAALRAAGTSLVCPWPNQLAASPIEHLVQPLLAYSWMASLPVRAANSSLRPSTVVSCGQFMMFDASAYRAIGGHLAVAGSPTEDLDIARALRRLGYRTMLTSGAGLVSCRMYDGWPALRDGYGRWLWSSFGGVAGTSAVAGALTLAYLVPPAAAVFGSGATRRYGLIGYGAAVAARLMSACTEAGSSRDLGRATLWSAAHPLSVSIYLTLTASSFRNHRRGTASWKGRLL
jgi:cellulose synthase/poly-beta-1,6-N-acetylglucosamine synthase-like glycosyltransferase